MTINGSFAAYFCNRQANIGLNVRIGPESIVDKGAVLEPNSRLGLSTWIQQGAIVGHDTIIYDGVVVPKKFTIYPFHAVFKTPTTKDLLRFIKNLRFDAVKSQNKINFVLMQQQSG